MDPRCGEGIHGRETGFREDADPLHVTEVSTSTLHVKRN
jgi:hypothetical protein